MSISPQNKPTESTASHVDFDELYKLAWKPENLFPEYDGFVERVEASIRQTFAERDHFPSEENWVGIRAEIAIIKGMALGTLRPDYYISPLPTGMGKTTAMVEATKELITIGEATGDPVGILIMTNTLSQIPKLIEEIGLREDQYAVRTGSANLVLNSMGTGQDRFKREHRHDKVQVLFTTQQMFLALASKEGDFEKLRFGRMFNFSFRHKPRAVRIWDEGILPANAYTVTADSIDHLKAPLKKAGMIEQRDQLEWLVNRMKSGQAGSAIDIPALDLARAEALFPENSDDARTIRTLIRMTEGRALLKNDPHHNHVMISYEESLPSDFAPVLILDAGALKRQVYFMWEEGRGHIEFLPEGKKTYRKLAIRHWRHAAGKQNLSNNAKRARIAQGVAEAVATSPHDKILIVVHKETRPGQNMENEINKAVMQRMTVEGHTPTKPAFLTWGKHLATNEFADYPHVIVVGLLLYAPIQAESLARASGKLTEEDELTEEQIAFFNKGEAANHVFQAAGRGHMRHAVGDDCPEGCMLDVIFSPNSGAMSVGPDFLPMVFPEAKIIDWHPLGSKLTPNEQTLVYVLMWYASANPEGVWRTKEQLAVEVGVTPHSVWETLRRPRVRQELARLGIAVRPLKGSHSGMHIRQIGEHILSGAEIERLDAAQAELRQRQAAKHKRIAQRELQKRTHAAMRQRLARGRRGGDGILTT